MNVEYERGYNRAKKEFKKKISNKIKELDINIQQCEYSDDDIEEYKKDMEKEKHRLLRDKKVLQEILKEE